jgi:hypothetical protein
VTGFDPGEIRTRRLLGLLLTAGLAAVALLVLSADLALANHVQCGDVITQDTTLDSDLSCGNATHGLLIGADNITLDLGGHTLRAPDIGAAGFGVVVGGGGDPRSFGDDVTVKNGRIEGFRGAVVVWRGHRDVIRGLEIVGANNHSIAADSSPGIVIEDNRIVATDAAPLDAIALGDVPDAIVRRNVVTSVTSSARRFIRGLIAADSDRITVEDNSITDAILGIHLDQVADGRVSGNHLAGVYTAIGVARVEGTVIDGNTLTDVLSGISIQGERSRVTDNLVTRSGAECTGGGIYMFGVSSDISFERNRVSGDFVNGLIVNDDPRYHSTKLTIEQNDASRICEDESRLPDYCDRDTRCGDGIVVDAPGALVRRNRTFFNANLGIEAVEGVLGGGNRAKHNGNPAQCIPTYLCEPSGKFGK